MVNVAGFNIGKSFSYAPSPDIAQELNLKMTSLDGGKVDFGKGGPFIISNPGCHQDVLDILNSGKGYQK